MYFYAHSKEEEVVCFIIHLTCLSVILILVKEVMLASNVELEILCLAVEVLCYFQGEFQSQLFL